MVSSLIDVPKDVEVLDKLVEKTLSNGMIVEVFLIKTPQQYEAALFVSGYYKPGPPLPRLLDPPTATAAYWMGVRPKAGLTQEEADEILGAVNVQNKMHHIMFVDKWGVSQD